jgi:putative inorganic carbon (HCO3(-)) transporter
MVSAIARLGSELIEAVSLNSADRSFAKTLNSSLLFGVWLKLKEKLAPLVAPAAISRIGSFLQSASFCLVALLFFIVADKHFANDKEGLALVVAAAFAVRMVGGMIGGKETYKPKAVDALVLFYFGANVVAAAASHYPGPSLRGLAKLAVYVISYFLFTGVLEQTRLRRALTIIACLVAGCLLVSLYGLYQYKTGVAPLATWEDPTIEDKATRIYSTLGNPNLLAGYLVPLVPVSFSLAMVAAIQCFKSPQKIWRLASPLFFGVTLIIGAATFLTGSRGGYIGLFAGMAALAAISCRWIWRQFQSLRLPLIIAVVATPLLLLIALHFFLPSFEHRFTSIFAVSEHSSNAYRMIVWRASAKMFEDSWWFGVGVGNQAFRLAYGLYMRSGFDALGTYCVPLEIAVEAGIPALLAFGWLLLAAMARADLKFWSSDNAAERWLIAGAAAGIAGMMFHGLVDTVFYRPQVQLIFWLLISLLVSDEIGTRQEQK